MAEMSHVFRMPNFNRDMPIDLKARVIAHLLRDKWPDNTEITDLAQNMETNGSFNSSTFYEAWYQVHRWFNQNHVEVRYF